MVGPAGDLVIDVDSTICQVVGKAKQGAGYGYTHKLGYHPLLATRADTGEIIHARMRKGSANTQRGARRFIDELIARARRAGATGGLTIRFDSGFWSNDTITVLNRLNVRYTMAVRCSSKGINDAITAIPDDAWTPIDYTDDGEAEVAECAYTTGVGKRAVTRRLIVRRTRLTDKQQSRLWPDWRHFGFLTDLDGTAVEVEKFHRRHAVVELAIRDLKEGARLEHVPSGNFHANSAWLQCAVLAHNLVRWTAIAGKVRQDNQLVVARTLRTRLLAIPGRLVNRAGRSLDSTDRATSTVTELADPHSQWTPVSASATAHDAWASLVRARSIRGRQAWRSSAGRIRSSHASTNRAPSTTAAMSSGVPSRRKSS